MASLLDKVKPLISADLNRWTDRALRSNEPALLQHQIRELQKTQEQVNDRLMTRGSSSTSCASAARSSKRLWSSRTPEVDQLLQAGLHEDAIAAQDHVNTSRMAAGQLSEQVERLETEYASMVEAKAQLARIAIMIQSEAARRPHDGADSGEGIDRSGDPHAG